LCSLDTRSTCIMRLASVSLLLASTCALNVGAPARVPRAIGAAARAAVSMEAIEADAPVDAAPAAAFVPPEVGSGFAGIPGAIELLEPEHPVLTKLLAKARDDVGERVNRAEFWTNETASVLELVNVLGRWQGHADILERSVFTQESYRQEDLRQSGTEKRYRMAQKMKCTERYGLMCNGPMRPFTDAKLAASVGLTCEELNTLPVSMAACNIVYDALAESRSGLIPYSEADKRRRAFILDDGALDLGRFKAGLYKSRAVVIFAWFWFGKGNFVWILVMARALADVRPDLFAFLNPATEEGKVLWKAFAIL